jgi:hypothetical protein
MLTTRENEPIRKGSQVQPGGPGVRCGVWGVEKKQCVFCLVLIAVKSPKYAHLLFLRTATGDIIKFTLRLNGQHWIYYY